jgi:hypothetical protein
MGLVCRRVIFGDVDCFASQHANFRLPWSFIVYLCFIEQQTGMEKEIS